MNQSARLIFRFFGRESYGANPSGMDGRMMSGRAWEITT
jgi:hypothetical protein